MSKNWTNRSWATLLGSNASSALKNLIQGLIVCFPRSYPRFPKNKRLI